MRKDNGILGHSAYYGLRSAVKITPIMDVVIMDQYTTDGFNQKSLLAGGAGGQWLSVAVGSGNEPRELNPNILL